MFANSVILFRSLPLNQKRSKFTGCCNKPAFIKLFETCDVNIVKPVSRYSLFIYLALSLRNVPKSLKTVSDIACV